MTFESLVDQPPVTPPKPKYLVGNYFNARENILTKKILEKWLEEISSYLQTSESEEILQEKLSKRIAEGKGVHRLYEIAKINKGNKFISYTIPKFEPKYTYEEIKNVIGVDTTFSKVIENESSILHGTFIYIKYSYAEDRISFGIGFPEQKPSFLDSYEPDEIYKNPEPTEEIPSEEGTYVEEVKEIQHCLCNIL